LLTGVPTGNTQSYSGVSSGTPTIRSSSHAALVNSSVNVRAWRWHTTVTAAIVMVTSLALSHAAPACYSTPVEHPGTGFCATITNSASLDLMVISMLPMVLQALIMALMVVACRCIPSDGILLLRYILLPEHRVQQL
jgi:hypothetical protein